MLIKWCYWNVASETMHNAWQNQEGPVRNRHLLINWFVMMMTSITRNQDFSLAMNDNFSSIQLINEVNLFYRKNRLFFIYHFVFGEKILPEDLSSWQDNVWSDLLCQSIRWWKRVFWTNCFRQRLPYHQIIHNNL